MFKSLLTVTIVASLILGVAVSSQAGYYGKRVTFVNSSPYKLYAYFLIDNYYADVWYCDFLSYDGVIYPGETFTYNVSRGLYGWFEFKTRPYRCNSGVNWQTNWVDARRNTCNQTIYIY